MTAAWVNCALLLQRSGQCLGGLAARHDAGSLSLERSTRAGRTARRLMRGSAYAKRGNKNYYKGRGARKYGKIDSKGRFHLDPNLIPAYDLPGSKPERVDEHTVGETEVLLPYVWRAPAKK